MADFADDAQAIQEQELALALAARTRHTLPPKGECYYCEEAVDGVKLFCDHECADGWEALQRANARHGRQGAHTASRVAA